MNFLPAVLVPMSFVERRVSPTALFLCGGKGWHRKRDLAEALLAAV